MVSYAKWRPLRRRRQEGGQLRWGAGQRLTDCPSVLDALLPGPWKTRRRRPELWRWNSTERGRCVGPSGPEMMKWQNNWLASWSLLVETGSHHQPQLSRDSYLLFQRFRMTNKWNYRPEARRQEGKSAWNDALRFKDMDGIWVGGGGGWQRGLIEVGIKLSCDRARPSSQGRRQSCRIRTMDPSAKTRYLYTDSEIRPQTGLSFSDYLPHGEDQHDGYCDLGQSLAGT